LRWWFLENAHQLSSAIILENQKLLRFKPDKRRTVPNPESGEAILICGIFTLYHADNLQLGKR